jgi:hypothetical protein
MAERVVRQVIDDIDGAEIPDGGGERITFSVRGIDYQIDLTDNNAAKFDKVLKPYLDAAAKIRGGDRRRRSRVTDKASADRLAAIRDWARANGLEVADRGRVKAEIIEAFEAAS